MRLSAVSGFFGRRLVLAVAMLFVCLVVDSTPARSGMIESVGTPIGGSLLTFNRERARIRWGGTSWEAAILKTNTPNIGTDQFLNPSGAPVWQVNTNYNFQIKYTLDYVNNSGVFDLSVDFNANGSFGTGESTSNTFSLLTTPNGDNKYRGIQISGNEGGSTARSSVSNLVINGTAVSNLTPNGGLVNHYYAASNLGVLSVIDITGVLHFTNISGATQERPVYNFVMQQGEVPEPTSMAIFGSALGGLVLRRYRKGKTGSK